MYKRKIPVDLNCGISIAREVVLSKWKYCILTEIEKGNTRPKDINKAVPDITKRVLHQQLKELELFNIIDKNTYAEVPPKVEYFLTSQGKDVLPLLQQIENWGLNFSPYFQKIIAEE